MPSHRSARHRRGKLSVAASLTGLAALLALAVIMPGSASAAPTTDPADTPLVQVPAMLGGLSHATYLLAAPAAEMLTLGIAVTGADPSGEAAMAAAQSNPSSPYYHRYLTPAQFAASYGVPAAQENAIVSWLHTAGFVVAPTSASGTYISATATVAQVESLFKVTEGSYVAGTIPFVANEDPPMVPSGLGIAAVTGLDTLRRFYTDSHQATDLTAADKTALVARARAEAAGVTPAVNVPVVATQIAQPRDLWSIYDQPNSDLGQGAISGVFGEGETDSVITQLRLFEAAEGFPKVPVKVIRTEAPTTEANYGDNTGSIEWYLDVQAMTGMAPDMAQLDLYFSKTLYDPDVFQSFSTWANDPNGPRQMNASFGECETNPTNPVTGPLSQLPYGTELGDDLEPVGEPILEQATMEGRTLFASAGDTGSGCPAVVVPVVGAGNGVAPSQPPLVNYPAASAWAVGVGGTVLTFTGAGATAVRTDEASWTDTGGGPSHFIAEPSFQKNVSAVDQDCVSQYDGTPYSTPTVCRGVPDVAALSGNILGNGYFIYIDGSPSSEGGTSLSSPLTVGMWTRLQAASSAPGGLGFAAPDLYSLYDYPTKGELGTYGKDFFDVTEEESGATNGTESPEPGWDYTSGLGVFDVGNLLTSLDGTQTPVSSAVPAEAPAVAACSTTEYSPSGNATDPADVQLGNDPSLDLTQTHFATDATSTHMIVTVTGPSFTAVDPAAVGGDEFKAQWLYNGVAYYIDAIDSEGTLTATDGNNNGATPSATDTATATLSADGTTLTMTAPFSELGSPGPGAELYYPGVTAILDAGTPQQIGTLTVESFTTDTASAGSYLQQSVGQALQLAPCTVETTPPAALPETPALALLPVVGGAAAFAVLHFRRRRRAPVA
jgi:pseudomonalisin